MYELQEQGHNLHIPVEGIAASRTPTPTTAIEQRQRFSLNGAGGYDYDYNCAPKEAMQRTLTPTLFTASDLRFFHHFLLVAYPHLPFGSDLAWVTVVPEYAHHVCMASNLSFPTVYAYTYKYLIKR